MSLLGRIRPLYLERRSAVVEVDRTMLYVRDGELFLDRGDPNGAEAIRALALGGQATRHAVAALARSLAGHRSKTRDETPRGAVELAGPLPTVDFLMELAVHGCGERELLNRVGGPQARFRTDASSPAMEQIPSLDPEMAQVLAALSEPRTAQEIIRGVTLDRFGALQGLAQLWAVGLAVQDDRPAEREPEPTPEASLPKVRPKILERLHTSVAENLAVQPLSTSPDEHRQAVASLWQSIGELDHYALLGLERDADSETLHKAFAKLARQVHPCHAAHLDLTGKDVMLQVLFERAVQAYWTLNDPGRRIAYNRTLAPMTQPVDAKQRGEEKRELARGCYQQGTQLLAANDVSAAVDVLREAVRMDARADYLSLLGQAQARNPAWTRHAIQSFQQALRLDPKDTRARLGLAEAYEAQNDVPAAIEQYRAVLTTTPDHAEARLALERLGASAPSSRATGRLRSLFTGAGDGDRA